MYTPSDTHTPPFPQIFRCCESIDCNLKQNKKLVPVKMTHAQPLSILWQDGTTHAYIMILTGKCKI